jgi:hypothetical protein
VRLRRWIRIDGPERIIEYLQKRDPSIEYPWDRVHPCEACRDLHHRQDLRAAVRKYADDVSGDVLLRFQLVDETEGLLTELGADQAAVGMAGGVSAAPRRPGCGSGGGNGNGNGKTIQLPVAQP